MASWALACKNCRTVFTHSQIPDTLADYYLPTRPEFPLSGVDRECPSRKTTATSTAFLLLYATRARRHTQWGSDPLGFADANQCWRIYF
jgi:hypothetical protein